MLGLPFPAGRHVDQLSREASNQDVFRVKCPGMQFSLSGVENKVRDYYKKNSREETAAFALRCVIQAVSAATRNAQKEYPGLPVVFSGGVASNSLLREMTADLKPVFSEPQYARDNAMGVAVLTHRLSE